MITSASVIYLLGHTTTSLSKQSDQILQEQLGIGISQYKILRLLEESPHISQVEIATNLGQTEASISRQIKLMLESGQLRIVVSTEDHRRHLTVPTRKGRRLAEAAEAALEKYYAPAFAALKPKQVDQLTRVLMTLHGETCPGAHSVPHILPGIQQEEQIAYIRFLTSSYVRRGN